MAEESGPYCTGEIFGHCIVNWKIKNIAFAVFKGGCIIHSSEISISEPSSTWKLFLVLKSEASDGDFCADLYLQRLESPGPDNVRANWKLRLLHDQCEEYSQECEFHFTMNSTFGIHFLTTAFFQQLTAPNKDTLNIQCQLIVSNIDDDRDFEQCDEYGLIALSEDLRALYMDSKYKDIVIRTKSREIRAHKEVLYYRNRVLAKLIDETNSIGPIILEIDNEAVETVIKFIYSSYLGFLLSKPSVSIYECIKYLNIEEAMWYYEPSEVILCTKVDIYESLFKWSIEDFGDKPNTNFTNTLLDKEDSKIFWELNVYPTHVNHGKRIAICVEIVEGITPKDASIELAVMNNNKVILASGRITKSLSLNEKVVWDGFVSNELLQNSLRIHSTLRFLFKFRISKGEIVATVVNRTRNSNYVKKQNYRCLSLNMESMHQHSQFPDIHLVLQRNFYPAHMCILAARSRTFAAMIDEMDRRQPYLYMSGMTSDILRILLYYIYCGVLKCRDYPDPQQMYEVSDRFAILTMKNICANFLTIGVRVESASSMLILANEKQDQEFKRSMLQFIYHNASEVFEQESWENLSTHNPLLREEVLNYIKSEAEKLQSSTETQETNTNIFLHFSNILTPDD